MTKQRAIPQSLIYSEVAEETGLTIAVVKKALEGYEAVTRKRIMEGKKMPLPGGMGYIHIALTRSNTQNVNSKLTDTSFCISPRLRSFVAFSKPWKEFINSNSKTLELSEKLLKEKKEKFENK